MKGKKKSKLQQAQDKLQSILQIKRLKSLVAIQVDYMSR